MIYSFFVAIMVKGSITVKTIMIMVFTVMESQINIPPVFGPILR